MIKVGLDPQGQNGVDYNKTLDEYINQFVSSGFPYMETDDQIIIIGEADKANTEIFVLDGSNLSYDLATHTVSGKLNSIAIGTLGGSYNNDGSFDLNSQGLITGYNSIITYDNLKITNPVGVRGETHEIVAELMYLGGSDSRGAPTFLAAIEDGGQDVTGTKFDDSYAGTSSADRVNGGAGNDTLKGAGGHDNIAGGSGADVVKGGIGKDTVDGGGGNDKLWGDGGNDDLSGGAGNDTINGGGGKDVARGGAGNDKLYGGGDGDSLKGDGGNDKLFGQAGGDTLKGGQGNDNLKGEAGSDKLFGEAGADTLLGNGGRDTLNGGGDNDHLDGGLDKDLILGGGGHDTLLGGNGSDELKGGIGKDLLVGGLGRDLLYGDGGADTFEFRSADEAKGDRIADFTNADTISLAKVGDFDFIGDARFSGTAGELRSVDRGGDAVVMGDIDGDGSSDFSFKVLGVTDLADSDFLL